MATVIDALLVSLGMDASAFEKGAEKAVQAQKKIEGAAVEGATTTEKQEKKTEEARKKRTTQQGKEQAELEKKDKEAREKRGKDVEAKAKQAAQGFVKMKNEALGFFAVLVGATGIKGFVENILTTAAGLDRVSANLGMSAKDLSMWQLANERAGGSAEGMTAQLKEAASEIAKFQTGAGSEKISSMLLWAARAGVSVNVKDLKNGNDLMMARAKVLQAMSQIDPAKALIAAGDMGVSEDTYNLIKQGATGVEELRQAQSRLAEEMAKNAPGAEELRKKINDLKNEFTAMGVKVMPLLMPQLERFTGWLEKSTPAINGFLDSAIKGTEKFGAVAMPILKMVAQGWKNIFGWVSILGEKIHSALPQSWSDWIGKKMAGVFGGGNAPATPAVAAPASAPARQGSAGQPRGMRNNNPGNIEYGKWAIAHGATGTDGRFATFPTMEAGQAAQQALLSGYLAQGNDTVGKVLNKWAPASENNTAAYISAVSKRIGVAPGQKLTAGNIPALADAISRHENGPAWDQRNAEAIASMPSGAGAAAASRQPGGGNSTSKTDVKVGQITINTKATDAAGIAKDIGPAMTQYGFLAQANGGMA